MQQHNAAAEVEDAYGGYDDGTYSTATQPNQTLDLDLNQTLMLLLLFLTMRAVMLFLIMRAIHTSIISTDTLHLTNWQIFIHTSSAQCILYYIEDVPVNINISLTLPFVKTFGRFQFIYFLIIQIVPKFLYLLLRQIFI